MATARPMISGCRTWPSTCCTSDHRAQHDQRDHPALVDQRDQHRDRAGDAGADDRDERAEEHQRGQRERERHVAGHQGDADADRVDERHQHGGPDVGAQRRPGRSPGVGELPAGVHREQPDQEPPDLAAVPQEEERREEHQHRAGHHLGQGRRGGDAGRGQRRRVPLIQFWRRVDGRVDLRVRQVQRPGPRPVLDLPDALAGVVGQLRHALDELVDHQGQRAHHRGEPADQHQERGQRPRQPGPQQPARPPGRAAPRAAARWPAG